MAALATGKRALRCAAKVLRALTSEALESNKSRFGSLRLIRGVRPARPEGHRCPLTTPCRGRGGWEGVTQTSTSLNKDLLTIGREREQCHLWIRPTRATRRVKERKSNEAHLKRRPTYLWAVLATPLPCCPLPHTPPHLLYVAHRGTHNNNPTNYQNYYWNVTSFLEWRTGTGRRN